MYQDKVLNHISTGFPKFFSVCGLKIKYISHTKGHYGQKILNKIQKERHMEDSKEQKVQKAQKCKWHGNEEQTNISVYHMLQSCGV